MAFAFISGNHALDLAGTRKWRNDAEPEELLRRPGDLRWWFDEAEDLPAGSAVDRKVLAAAIDLRESIYRLARSRLSVQPFDPADLDVVNEHASKAGSSLRLGAAGLERDGSASQALADVARSAVLVLSDPSACLKECGRPTCTRIYVDRSRGTRRTWCGMDECGNRVKAAAYRARKRAATATT